MQPKVTDEMNAMLTHVFTKEEVRDALRIKLQALMVFLSLSFNPTGHYNRVQMSSQN